MANFAELDGKWEVDYVPKKASTAFTAGNLVAPEAGTGKCEPAVDTHTELYGIGLKDVAATDADYASNAPYAILMPKNRNATMTGKIGNGTAATTSIDGEFDLTAAGLVDIGASATDVLQMVEFVNTSECVFVINKPVRA